jgi:hypothetical protein
LGDFLNRFLNLFRFNSRRISGKTKRSNVKPETGKKEIQRNGQNTNKKNGFTGTGVADSFTIYPDCEKRVFYALALLIASDRKTVSIERWIIFLKK